MACVIKIYDVKGIRSSASELPYGIRVKGTAEECNEVIVHTDCMKPSTAKDTVVYSSGNPEGQWEVIVPYQSGGSRCKCDGRITVTALCLSPENPDCERGEYVGSLECVEEKEECPKSVEIKVFNSEGADITEQVLHDSCHLYGTYTFEVGVSPSLLPSYNIQLTIKVDDVEIYNIASDPRVANLTADNSRFDFTFGGGNLRVEIIAAVFTDGFPGDGCAIKQDAIELQACEDVCPPGQTYNPETGKCEDREHECPPGQVYNPLTGKCEDREHECPPGQVYNPETGKCEDRDTNGGGSACSIWCILAGIFLIAFPISAHISTAAYCAAGIVLAAQAAAIVAVIAWYIKFCGVCCLYPFIYAGAILGIIAILIASIWMGFPGCLAVGLSLLVGYVAAAAGFQAACNSK